MGSRFIQNFKNLSQIGLIYKGNHFLSSFCKQGLLNFLKMLMNNDRSEALRMDCQSKKEENNTECVLQAYDSYNDIEENQRNLGKDRSDKYKRHLKTFC